MSNVYAFDLALTTTGWAGPDGTFGTIETSDMRGPQRLDHILQSICDMLTEDDGSDYHVPVLDEDAMVVVEGVSFGSKGNSLVELGKLHGLVEHLLWTSGIPYVVGITKKRNTPQWGVPPGTLKKYATGSGNAPKVEMVVAARERLGVDTLDDNVADALWLRAVGLELLDRAEVRMPKVNRGALDRLRWSTEVVA